MEEKKSTYAVRYYTRGGHTRMLAEAIAEELGCEAFSTSQRLSGYTDILFLGGAVYANHLDPNITGFIDHFDRSKVGKIILFGDAAVTNPCKKMRARLAGRGIPAETDEFYCRGSFKLLYRSHPDADDIRNAREFARRWRQMDPAAPQPVDAGSKYANIRHWAE